MKTSVIKCEAKSIETKLTKITKKKKKKCSKKRAAKFLQRRHIEQSHPKNNASENRTLLNNNSGAQIWQNTYLNAIQWQCEQKVKFWKDIAMKYKEENDVLKRQLEESLQKVNIVEKVQEKIEENVDEQFISFLEITAKHRMERFIQKIKEEESDS